MFFGLVSVYFYNISQMLLKEHSRSFKKKSRSREYNYLILSIIKNVERASTARARASPETSTCDVPNDVGLTLPADSVYENGIVEVSLL